MGQCPLVVQQGVQELVVAHRSQVQFLTYRAFLGAGARKAPAFEGEDGLLALAQFVPVHGENRSAQPPAAVRLSAVAASAWSAVSTLVGLPLGLTAVPIRFLMSALMAAQDVLPAG
jgi:hypothetical protein